MRYLEERDLRSMRELVSVVITTYERTVTLKRAIESVLNQTYDNIEIIVVDDNKRSMIREKVKEIVYSFERKNIRLICNIQNLGGALSRNVGIEAAKGEYIAFLDDDDEYVSEKLEKQIYCFSNSKIENLALVYCYCKEIGKNNKTILYHYDYRGNCLYQAMVDCIAATSQWCCRKSALVAVGMFSDVPCKQDSTVMLKLLINGYGIDRVPEYLSIYHSDGVIRISTGGHEKRIVGEEKLRSLCRMNYAEMSDKQIAEIEYSFSTRLAEHYYAVKDLKKFKIELYRLFKHPFRRKTLAVYKHILIK